MATNITLDNVVSGYNLGKINVNFQKIELAFNDVLSRTGGSPNHMLAPFDMNGFQILNLPEPVDPNDAVRFQDISGLATGVADAQASAAAALVSETNAAASEANAATSASTALDAATNVSAATRGIAWDFEDDTTMADPGLTMLRLNNSDLTAVTSIAVSAEDYLGNDVSDFVATVGDSTSPNKGTLTIRKVNDPSFFVIYTITSTVVDSGSWLQSSLTYVDHSGTLTDGDRLFLHFARTGDQGASGGGSGDMVSTNNLSDVADVPTSRSNLGLGSLATSNSVTTAQINNLAVTEGKIAASAVTEGKIGTSAVTETKIADNAVTNAKMADDSVGPNELQDTTVTAGTYTSADITVDAQGRVTAAASGGGGGSLELISATSLSGNASVSLTWDESLYSKIEVVIEDASFSLNSRFIEARLTYNNGVTDETGPYSNASGAAADTVMSISASATNSSYGTTSNIMITGASGSLGGPIIDYKSITTESAYKGDTSFLGNISDQERVYDGIRLFLSGSGAFDSGTAYVYGWKNA